MGGPMTGTHGTVRVRAPTQCETSLFLLVPHREKFLLQLEFGS